MKFDNVNMNEMEHQRYEAIKNTGKYMELTILIGEEDETFDGQSCKVPVVTSVIHDCGPREVSSMYMTLKALIKQYEEEFPMECMLGELTMNPQSQGVFTTRQEIKKKKES